MPKNKLMYIGILVIVASALLWLGAQITKTIEWMLPYSGVAGLILIIAGFFLEARKKGMQQPSSSAGSSAQAGESYTAASSGTEAGKNE